METPSQFCSVPALAGDDNKRSSPKKLKASLFVCDSIHFPVNFIKEALLYLKSVLDPKLKKLRVSVSLCWRRIPTARSFEAPSADY